jgi:hypothetical protein
MNASIYNEENPDDDTVLFGVSFIVFCMIYFTPGDPAEYMLGMDANEQSVATLRTELGLDKPFFVQYFNYIKNIILHGDFGISYTTRRSVTQENCRKAAHNPNPGCAQHRTCNDDRYHHGHNRRYAAVFHFRQHSHHFRPHWCIDA